MIPFKGITIAFLNLQYLIELYLDIRQYRSYKITIPPPDVDELLKLQKQYSTEKKNKKLQEQEIHTSEEKSLDSIPSEESNKEEEEEDPMESFLKSQKYQAEKSRLSFLSDGIDHLITILILNFNFYPYLWNFIGVNIIKTLLQISSETGLSAYSFINRYPQSIEIIQSLIFFYGISAITMIIKLPFSLYSTFVIEEKFGFNRETIGRFIKDLLLSVALGVVIGSPIIAILIEVIRYGGEKFYIFVWLFMLSVSIFLMLIYPTFIAPLFNKFTPLSDSDSLMTAIKQVAEKVKFPLKKIFIMDASNRSGHSNAYFYGLFKNKHIVLYDTLKEKLTDDEIVPIISHELGHWSHSHVLKLFCMNEVFQIFIWYLFGLMINSQDLYTSFGFSEKSIFVGLLCYTTILTPLNHIFGLFLNFVSRKFEYQADSYATKLGFDLTIPLIKLSTSNLSDLIPDPLYSLYHYTHPTLLERISAIKKLLKKKD